MILMFTAISINQEYLVLGGLATVMAIVLLAPFLHKKIEEELETFLFVMGIVSVSISRLWSWHLVHEALTEPIKISVAVLIAGIGFRFIRPKIRQWTNSAVARFGYAPLLFVIVAGLGLISSIITAIIAALILAEVVSALKLSRNFEVKVVIIACFSIGLGAALTPLGEPLATIAVSKLKGEPYHADFFFLARLLAVWVIPLVLGLALWTIFFRIEGRQTAGLTEDKSESYPDVLFRALKVYLFVMALVLLGEGFKPIVEKYVVNLPAHALYWINTASAVLDNATLTAAEISPAMKDLETIKELLLGLLIAGGMLIPGNIPNIICAGKLSIKSKEWAKFGLPLGLAIMTGIFLIQLIIEHWGF
jgi:predicted cation transporter